MRLVIGITQHQYRGEQEMNDGEMTAEVLEQKRKFVETSSAAYAGLTLALMKKPGLMSDIVLIVAATMVKVQDVKPSEGVENVDKAINLCAHGMRQIMELFLDKGEVKQDGGTK